MMKTKYFFTLTRMTLGLMYIISGTEKLWQPYQNFLYIIHGYDMVPFPVVAKMMALILPWLEFFLGGFLLLGLWTKEGLVSLGFFTVIFIIAVGQAMVRKLPLAECGCFGDLVGMPLAATFVIDIVTLLLVILLLYLYNRGEEGWGMDLLWRERKDV
jgi:uncharacterized membrane protein YphA (DoxX/SURF4 family)